jgi:GDP-L-fucose synthase
MTRYLVTGGHGFLGHAVFRVLRERGIEPLTPTRQEYDLTDEAAVARLYADARPDVVIHLAAEVGGIGANMAQPGRFFYANMAMGLHLVEHARRAGVRKFVHVGTVCAYPKHCPVPFREDDLWNGYPEETNAPYGVAKKALFVMLDAYRRQYGMASSVVVPVNLYGPGDDFDPATSHVIPAMIRRFCEGGNSVTLWGTGTATREFLHVDDAAAGVVRAAEVMDEPVPINLGGGEEVTIATLAGMVADACGYSGRIQWDASLPDGQPRRALDCTRAGTLLGWRPSVRLADGLAETVQWWLNSPSAARQAQAAP